MEHHRLIKDNKRMLICSTLEAKGLTISLRDIIHEHIYIETPCRRVIVVAASLHLCVHDPHTTSSSSNKKTASHTYYTVYL